MSEWFKEAVLKTAVRQRTVGSNPTLSATIQLNACAVGCIFLTWCLQEGETVDKMYADRETILALRVPGNLFRAAICKGCLNSVDKRFLPIYNVP